MTLVEVKRILDLQKAGTAPCEWVPEMLDDRIAEIDQRLSDLALLRETLLAARCIAESSSVIESNALVCRIIEQMLA